MRLLTYWQLLKSLRPYRAAHGHPTSACATRPHILFQGPGSAPSVKICSIILVLIVSTIQFQIIRLQ